MKRFDKYITHVVRIVRFPVRRVFEQQSLEPEDLAYRLFRRWCKNVRLQFVNVVVSDYVLKDCIEFVKDLDPCIEIGTRPTPGVDLAKDLVEVVFGGVEELVDKLRNLR